MNILWLTEDFVGIRKFLIGESRKDEGMPAQYKPLIYFSNKGHKIDIISFGDKSVYRLPISHNIKSTVLKKPSVNLFTKFGWRDVRVVFFIKIILSTLASIKFIRKKQYDVIYSNWEFQSVVGAILSYLFKIPNVVRLYGSNLYGRTGGNLTFKEKILHFNRYLPFIVKKELLIITEDGTQANKIIDVLNIDKTHYISRLNGVDFDPEITDYGYKYKFLIDKFIISYIGNIGGWKRPDLFLNSLNDVIKIIPNVNYLIIGDGDQLKKLKGDVLELGLEKYVTFTGRVTQEERIYLQTKSDIYVSLYEYTNLTNTFLESIANGIPSLVIPNGRTKIVAKNKINCLFIDESNIVESLIKKIEYLYNHSEFRKYLGIKAKIYARKHLLSWDERCAKDLSLIEKVVEKNRSFC